MRKFAWPVLTVLALVSVVILVVWAIAAAFPSTRYDKHPQHLGTVDMKVHLQAHSSWMARVTPHHVTRSTARPLLTPTVSAVASPPPAAPETNAPPAHTTHTAPPPAVTTPAPVSSLIISPATEPWAHTATARAVYMCESSGNVHVTSNPRYRGKWQIGFTEWRTYGGLASGVSDPAYADEIAQDEIAHRIWLARGWSPWDCAA